MKIITLWQPYATLVAIGAKAHETRSWPTRYRGPLLIHAARRFDAEGRDDCARASAFLVAHRFRAEGGPAANIAEMPWRDTLGKVLCVAHLSGCHPTPRSADGAALAPGEASPLNGIDRAFGDWSPGRFAWALDFVRPLPGPIPWRGVQGLTDAPADLVAAVVDQFREVTA